MGLYLCTFAVQEFYYNVRTIRKNVDISSDGSKSKCNFNLISPCCKRDEVSLADVVKV